MAIDTLRTKLPSHTHPRNSLRAWSSFAHTFLLLFVWYIPCRLSSRQVTQYFRYLAYACITPHLCFIPDFSSFCTRHVFHYHSVFDYKIIIGRFFPVLFFRSLDHVLLWGKTTPKEYSPLFNSITLLSVCVTTPCDHVSCDFSLVRW